MDMHLQARLPGITKVKARLTPAQGVEVVYTTSEEFDGIQRAEIQKWSKVIRDAKLQAQ